MRLTLRTMLAYIDNILEPSDAQLIGKRIEESEFATNLMHRTREVARRLRLGAPKLDGRGLALDPNTVAEYLDNELPSERVPDFEKVCLESDMHLAEVASAHQILALVLGEPAEIDAAMRERMYKLASQPAATVAEPKKPAVSDTEAVIPSRTPAPEAAETMARPAAEPPKSARQKPQVPDYLREPPKPKGSPGKVIAAVFAAVLLCAIGAIAMNYEQFLARIGLQPIKVADQPNSGTAPTTATPSPDNTQAPVEPVAPQVAAQQPPSGAVPPATGPAAPGATTGGGAPLVAPGPAPAQPGAAQNVAVPPATAPLPPAAAGVSPQGAPAGGLAMPGAVQPGTAATMPAAPSSMAPLPGPVGPVAPAAPGGAPPLGMPGPGAGVAAGTSPAPLPPGVAQPGNVPPGVGQPGPAGPATTGVPGPAMAGAIAGTNAPPAPAGIVPNGPAPAAANPDGIGRFMDGELLVRFNPADGLWHRVPNRTTVFAGDRVMSLPTFRCAMTLSTGVNVDLLGGTEVVLLGPNAQGVPGIEILEGRVVLISAGTPGAALRVRAAGREGVIALGNASSTAAFEVAHRRAEGTDPIKIPASITVEMFVATGDVQWTESSGTPPETLTAPARRLLVGADAVAALNEVPSLPAWVTTTDDRTPMQKRAGADLPRALPGDRPLTLGLKELAADRKIETSLLAIQCLAAVGDFDTLVTALRDPNQKAVWNDEVESLRTAIARNPETAQLVDQAFQRHYGTRGSELFRMLWGYTSDDVRPGSPVGSQLVKWLDSEDLEYRVLAFAALTRMSGGQTHFYRPEYTAARRQQYIVKWKQRLDSGQLIPKAAGAP
ncbi:MAG TPA: hypothetical protein VHZ24_10305 [Pirellulales bacterium]|nr:hypothetical protein [Pirellulales bacterium]